MSNVSYRPESFPRHRLAHSVIATVGQLQLLQPLFGLGLSVTLLHETVSPLMLAVTLGVILSVAGSRKFA